MLQVGPIDRHAAGRAGAGAGHASGPRAAPTDSRGEVGYAALECTPAAQRAAPKLGGPSCPRRGRSTAMRPSRRRCRAAPPARPAQADPPRRGGHSGFGKCVFEHRSGKLHDRRITLLKGLGVHHGGGGSFVVDPQNYCSLFFTVSPPPPGDEVTWCEGAATTSTPY